MIPQGKGPPTAQEILDSKGGILAPWPGSPQELALRSSADIVIFGGAAGGAKTYGMLLKALYYFQDPHYRAACFRRTYKQIDHPGALIDETRQVFPRTGAEFHETRKRWTWPSGAQFQFAHLEHESNLEDWDGAQLCGVFVDQLEQFMQRALFYLQGRCRSARWQGHSQVFATCNPAGPGHWLTNLVRPWLRPAADGLGLEPDPAESGRKRWIFREGDEVRFVDSSARDVDGEPPISIAFVPATADDNPAIMENDRSYLARLNSLGYVDMLEKRKGRWGISKTVGPYAGHAIQVVPRTAVPAGLQWFRYWDLAGTEPSPKNPDPCHTAGVKGSGFRRFWSWCGVAEEEGDPMCTWWQEGDAPSDRCPACGQMSVQRGPSLVMVIDDPEWFRLAGHSKKARIRAKGTSDGLGTIQIVELEGGSMAKDAGQDYRTEVFRRGTRVVLDRPTGAKSARVSMPGAMASRGRFWIVEGPRAQDYLHALEKMDPLDVADATAGLYKYVRQYATVSDTRVEKPTVHATRTMARELDQYD